MAPTGVPSQTGTSGFGALSGVANLQNLCPGQKSIACLTWSDPSGISYSSFKITWSGQGGGSQSTTTNNHEVTLVGLSAGTPYNVQIIPTSSAGATGATTTFSFTTANNKFNGIKNVNCARKAGNIVCRWRNGVTRYSFIKLVAKCKGSKRVKQIIAAGKSSYTLKSVGTGCQVIFVPHYVTGKQGPRTTFSL